VREQGEAAAALLTDDLIPALAAHGIHIHHWKELDAETQRAARRYFRRSVFPVLTPLAVDPGHPFPFLSNLSLSLAVGARDPETKERRFARVKVPESLPRFIPFACFFSEEATVDSAAADVLPLEQLIAANLDDLFTGMEILGCHPFRVTRDMDIDILDDEAHDLLSIVDREVRRRRFGACVRLEVDVGIPDRIRARARRRDAARRGRRGGRSARGWQGAARARGAQPARPHHRRNELICFGSPRAAARSRPTSTASTPTTGGRRRPTHLEARTGR